MNKSPTPDLDQLFADARAAAPDHSRLEYAFETRLLARLAEERSGSVFSWAWRLCPYFAALALAAAFWSRTTTAWVQAQAPLWAEAGRGEEHALVSYMTGESQAQ